MTDDLKERLRETDPTFGGRWHYMDPNSVTAYGPWVRWRDHEIIIAEKDAYITDLEARLAAAEADNRRLIGNAKAQGILDDIGAAGKSRAKQARNLAFKIGEQRKEIRRLKERLAAAEAGEDALADTGENLAIAIGMGWDLEGVIDAFKAALAAYAARRKG